MTTPDVPDAMNDDLEIIYLDDDEVIEEDSDNDQMDDTEHWESVVDMSKLSFKKHTNHIYAGALSKDGRMAVTGAKDDMAYVWNTQTGQVIFECTGHKDSVTEVGFNFDDQYVVTCDMRGLVQVWTVKDGKLFWCDEGDDIQWLCWHHSANIIIAGRDLGDIYIWQIPQGNCKVLPSHGSFCSSGKLLEDGKTIIAGYGDGIVKLWDIKTATAIWQIDKSLQSEITNITFSSEKNLVAVSPAGETFKLSDGKFVNRLNRENLCIEVMLFNGELNVLINGTLEGLVCIWDVARQTMRHNINLRACITVMKWLENDKFICGTTSGEVHIIDAKSGNLCKTITGHYSTILSLDVSFDKTFILTTSEDLTAKIFYLNLA